MSKSQTDERPSATEPKFKRCPIQDGDSIPMWLARLVHRGYAEQYGHIQSLERIIERGGFGKGEVVVCLTWLGLDSFEAWKQFERYPNVR